MTKLTDRRRVLAAGAGLAAAASAASAAAQTRPAAPALRTGGPRPVVIASGNGQVYKNGGTETCVERAFRLIVEGADMLDALVAGVSIVELDPLDTSVGYGGLPDADGEVTLDASVMHGPRKLAGAVAALKGVRTPAKVAQQVALFTDHHLIVGQGAQDFARRMGHAIEADLNTETSRNLWLEWKQRSDPEHFVPPAQRADLGDRVAKEMIREGKIDPDHYYGTINCSAVNAAGDMCGVTTTSGLAWKIPGRVGDSPILGAGLYVDNAIGAAGSTGRGEANLYNLASFLIVEFLRAGMSPKDAGMAVLGRILGNTEKRLLTADGKPTFNVNFYVLAKSGVHAGVAFYSAPTRKYAVCDANGGRLEPIEGLLGEQPL